MGKKYERKKVSSKKANQIIYKDRKKSVTERWKEKGFKIKDN